MQYYCKIHPDYQAKRKPKNDCFSCWRLFLEDRRTTVEVYASSVQNTDLDRWLRENIDSITEAPLSTLLSTLSTVLEDKQNIASFQTPFSFVPVPSDVEPDDVTVTEEVIVPSDDLLPDELILGKKEDKPAAFTGTLI